MLCKGYYHIYICFSVFNIWMGENDSNNATCGCAFFGKILWRKYLPFRKYQDTCGKDLNPLSRVMSVKFLLVISLLYKTEWS